MTRKPDHTFRITVSPVYYVKGCAVKLEEEAKGFYGFHNFHTCPNCIRQFAGWEMWGENGHMQGSAPTRDRLIHWLRLKARHQWKASGNEYTPAGSHIGFRFKLGSAIYYRG